MDGLVMDITDRKPTYPCDLCGIRLATVYDDENDIRACRRCCLTEEPRDEAYERAAARARGNDFERTNNRDWT